MKRAVLKPMAERDLIDATCGALGPIRLMPGLSSPALGNECGLPGLRQWGVGGFPVNWYYFERNDRLDVVRLLGDRQDIATILADDVRAPN